MKIHNWNVTNRVQLSDLFKLVECDRYCGARCMQCECECSGKQRQRQRAGGGGGVGRQDKRRAERAGGTTMQFSPPAPRVMARRFPRGARRPPRRRTSREIARHSSQFGRAVALRRRLLRVVRCYREPALARIRTRGARATRSV